MKAESLTKLTSICLVAGVALLALALRLFRLDFQPLWWDEGYSVFFATRDLSTMLARTAVDIHPPFYYALLQVWMAAAGRSDEVLRFLSVMIGVASIPLIYLIGSTFFSRRVGIVSALLLAISPLHVYYSQEVRMYGLVTLLALVSIQVQVLLLKEENRPRNYGATQSVHRAEGAYDSALPNKRQRYLSGLGKSTLWCLYVLATTVTLYTQYYSAFVLLSEIVVVIYLQRRAHANMRTWLFAWSAIFVLYLPWIMYAAPKLYDYVNAKVGIEQYSRLDPITFIGQHLIAFSVGHLSEIPWLGWAAALFLGLAVFAGFAARLGSNEHTPRGEPGTTSHTLPSLKIILIYFLIPLFCGWLVNLVYTFHPLRYERLLLFVAPLFLILVSVGLETLFASRRGLAFSCLGVVGLISAASLYDFYTVQRYPDEDYRPLIREMVQKASPGDLVLAPYPWQIGYLESYYPNSRLQVVEVPGDEWITHPGELELALNSIHASNPRAWLLAYQTKGRLLEDEIANYFADDYHLVDDWYGNTRLEYFSKSPDPPINDKSIVLSPDVRLDSFGALTGPIAAGKGSILVRLHWEAKSDSYSYSLRLIDENGLVQTQLDGSILQGNAIDRVGVFVPSEVPGGDYQLRLVVYLRADGSPLALADGSHEFTLARVLVASN